MLLSTPLTNCFPLSKIFELVKTNLNIIKLNTSSLVALSAVGELLHFKDRHEAMVGDVEPEKQ